MHRKHNDQYWAVNLDSCITELGKHWADKLSLIINILRFMFLLFITRRVSPLYCRHLLWLANKLFLYRSLCHQFQIQRQSQPKHCKHSPMHCRVTLRQAGTWLIRQRFFRRHLLLTLISKFFFTQEYKALLSSIEKDIVKQGDLVVSHLCYFIEVQYLNIWQ